MKWLNQISIKVKVMLPICILGIVILLASISSLVNSKRLLQAGVVISQDCSKSIELLMDMSSELESMGKNMYGHCDAENSISKESFATTIHEKLESMDSYFKQYKKQKKTAREKEYFGALQNRFKKYKEGMEQYYPVNDETNDLLAEQYRQLALQEQNEIFGGRLAEYKYYDMAPIIEKVMEIFRKGYQK